MDIVAEIKRIQEAISDLYDKGGKTSNVLKTSIELNQALLKLLIEKKIITEQELSKYTK